MTVQLNTNANTTAQMQQMLVDNITGAPTEPSDGSGAPVYLTPEALMAYCQSRLQSIDGQVQGDMVTQQNMNWEQQQVGNLMSQVSALEATVTNNDTSGANGYTQDPAKAQQLEQSIEDLISQIQQRDPGSAVIGQLEQLHDTVMATGTGPYTDPSGATHGYYYQASGQTQTSASGSGGSPLPSGTTPPPGVRNDHDGSLGTNELQAFTTTLQGINSSLNNSAEMGMIDIQSQMSQRSTAIQLVTNIMQSYDQGLSSIVSNIGRAT